LDLAVDAGVTEAAKELQEVVGARADSSIGPATVAATKAMPPREVVKRLTERRAKIGKGQTDRIDAVAKAAIEMTDAAIAAI
jgi:lysozyme family protein